MADFQDRFGNPVLPTTDVDGSLPVRDRSDQSVLERIFLELRAIRVGLELRLELDQGDLLKKAE